jgi:hypothetical protein
LRNFSAAQQPEQKLAPLETKLVKHAVRTFKYLGTNGNNLVCLSAYHLSPEVYLARLRPSFKRPS